MTKCFIASSLRSGADLAVLMDAATALILPGDLETRERPPCEP